MAEGALTAHARGFLDCASAMRSFADAPVSGDRLVLVRRPGGILLAVIDGLGHGAEAAAAASAAATAIEHNASESPEQILRRCHLASSSTRGSAITLATIDLETAALMWAAVGNVAGVVLHGEPTPTIRRIRGRAGIIGSRLPRLHAETVPLRDGDLALLATDGTRPDFACVTMRSRPLRRIVDAVLAEHAVPKDDALVLAARYHHTDR